ALRDTVIAPVLGDSPSTLSLDQWKRIRRALKCFADYLEQKQGADVESLPVETLRRYADGQDAAALEALIDADEKVSEIVNGAQCLEKAILYQKYLLRLLNNFVSFTELYTADQRALFESGSLLIDGRWFNLALRVDDAKTHSIMAKGSNIFIIYLEITRQSGKPEYTIAVPATAGTKGNLVVGKRGVFFDLAGREFDARILQIIENPISLTEALCLPFHRLWAFILGKIEALSSSSEKELQKATDAMLKERTTPVAQAPAGANSAMLMGLSVSVAALGSAFAFISSSLAGMTKTQLMSSVLGAAALVIVPVSLVAIFKLRRQDLSALLEGCGWGVNARMRFTFSLRRQFTCRKPYPSDATGAPRSRVLIYILIGLLAFMGLRACNKALLAPQPDSSKVNASTQ
ncbi:MAG: hypothetical protein OSB41_13110, partial [Kiritimatiellae bacterium]|nr:hypothetical protein [Kiritimatiellia bacterium]